MNFLVLCTGNSCLKGHRGCLDQSSRRRPSPCLFRRLSTTWRLNAGAVYLLERHGHSTGGFSIVSRVGRQHSPGYGVLFRDGVGVGHLARGNVGHTQVMVASNSLVMLALVALCKKTQYWFLIRPSYNRDFDDNSLVKNEKTGNIQSR